MTKIVFFLSLIIIFASCTGPKNQYPGPLKFRSYRIGQKIDTSLFIKKGDLYFPNYLDGWNMGNYDHLPEKYSGLPIALWESKKDSGIVLSLLNTTVLNITVSYMTAAEKEKNVKMATEKFGNPGEIKSYEEPHPLQEWITYWNLQTWETPDVILQIGNSDMRKPQDSIPADISWNLVYSDFRIEDSVIADYKKGR